MQKKKEKYFVTKFLGEQPMDQETKRNLELIQLETRYKSTYQTIK